MKDDAAFSSLSEQDGVSFARHPTRRKLLDKLLKHDGQCLSALERRLPMTRFGVMKHLKLLEEAGLIVTRRQGREKLETGETLTTPGSWSRVWTSGCILVHSAGHVR